MLNENQDLQSQQPDHQEDLEPIIVSPEEQSGYIGEHSLFAGPKPAESVSLARTSKSNEKVHEQFLKTTGALIPPLPPLLEAATASYFSHVAHRIPVVDHGDLLIERPSILLLHALTLVHALLRHPKDFSKFDSSEEIYLKLKTLLFVNHEKDNLTTLKALCLLHAWNKAPPVVVTLDGPWHWVGVTIRLAFQMGLHRESTYSKIKNPAGARRVAWYLFVSVLIQS